MQQDAIAAALERGRQVKAAILQDSYTQEELEALLVYAPSYIKFMQRNGLIIALELDSPGEYVYPKWQFVRQQIIPGLAVVLRALVDTCPWGQVIFFTTGDLCLDGATPLEALKAGRVKDVIKAAKQYGVHSAV